MADFNGFLDLPWQNGWSQCVRRSTILIWHTYLSKQQPSEEMPSTKLVAQSILHILSWWRDRHKKDKLNPILISNEIILCSYSCHTTILYVRRYLCSNTWHWFYLQATGNGRLRGTKCSWSQTVWINSSFKLERFYIHDNYYKPVSAGTVGVYRITSNKGHFERGQTSLQRTI